jgi:serpin B
MNMRFAFVLMTAAVSSLGLPSLRAREPVDEAVKSVAVDGNAFGLALYGHLVRVTEKEQDAGNLFFSPTSIHTALAMTYAGASGRTAEQMRETLRFELDGESLHAAVGGLGTRLSSPPLTREKKPPYELSVANALWGQEGYELNSGFLSLVRNSYHAPFGLLNFADSEDARKTINAWVAEETREKIQDLVPPRVLSRRTRLVLTNAIYFKSSWRTPFSEELTEIEPFHVASGREVRVPLMHDTDHYDYAEHESLQVLRLPYAGRELSMIVLLPTARDGLSAIEADLSEETLATWLKPLRGARVEVAIPKFEFTSEFRLEKILPAMGMRDAFDVTDADFSGMSSRGERELFISACLHKAFVAVDEEGTEAAAATAVVMNIRSAPDPGKPKVFRADHPFLFLIRHEPTGAIIFMGRVVNPEG